MTDPESPASLDGYVPFPDERAARYEEAGHWEDVAFHDVLDRAAAENPAGVAAVDPRRERTYEELVADTERIAAFLAGELGIGENERVVFQLTNRVEFVQAFFACSRVGAIPVMLLPRHREAEARHVLDLTDAVAYVTVGDGRFDYLTMVDDLYDDFDALEHRIAVVDDGNGGGEIPDGWIGFSDAYETDYTEVHGDAIPDTVDPRDPGVMLLSGGTTGMPKGIPRTHNDYVFQWKQMAAAAGITDEWNSMPCIPIGHNASLCCIVGATVYRGGTVVIAPSLKPDSLLSTMEERAVDYIFAVPTQLVDVLEHPDIDEYDLPALRAVISGGQKVRPKLVYEFVDRWGVGFLNIFGMAEGPLICTRPEDDPEIQATTVGHPIAPAADETRIVDTDRETEVPTGDAGELVVRGPGFFTGYFRHAEENAENFDDEGWFYTEDVLRERLDGRFEVLGRIKDTIIRGGENIYAPGVEDEIIEHPAVENVAVVAMPDERLGERPLAYVELREGASLTLDELSDFLDGRGVAVFKRPERLEVVRSLPRTEVGKIDKATLKDRVTEQLRETDELPDDWN